MSNVTTALIEVKQLPIIEEQLRSLQEEITNIVNEAMALACTEETVISVKERRAELNKLFGELEQRRKAVKAEIMAPYDRFEAVYKDCVSGPFKAADAALRQKITDTEAGIKARCEEKLKKYFDELCRSYDIDWLTWDRVGVKVDMASAKQDAPKKLMAEVCTFVFGVATNLKWIANMEHADEIMVEYKKTLNAVEAASTVAERHRRMDAEAAARQEAQERAAAQKEEAPHVPATEAFSVPKRVQQAQEERLTVAFEVTDTVERLKMLKQWLIANNYDFE